MSTLCRQLLKLSSRKFIRTCQPIRHKLGQGSYEGEGKTTMTILNRDSTYGLMIDTISQYGFELNLKFRVLGPMLIFPRSVIGWNIGEAGDINESSLTIFKILEPRPDIVVLGLDQKYPRDAPFLLDFERIMKSLGISWEILPIHHACTTFNYLNSEKRYCVGALMPPREVGSYDRIKIEQQAYRRELQAPISKIKNEILL